MNMLEVKRSLRYSALKVLEKQLDTGVMASLSKLASMDGFSSITLGELMEGYNPNPGPKTYTAKDLQMTTVVGIRRMVLKYVQHYPTATIPDIARKLNLKNSQVSYAIHALEETCKIEMVGKVKGRNTYQAH